MRHRDEIDRIPDGTIADLDAQVPIGFLTTLPDGTIAKASPQVLAWTGLSLDDLVGRRRLPDLLRVGGRIYYETHISPLLELQGRVDEIALELVGPDGDVVPVLVSARVVAGDGEVPAHVRSVLFDATGRHDYERELVRARRDAEAAEGRAQDVAHTLQQSLLQGALQHGSGFQVEARYRPGVENLEVGGDWYDAFPIDADTISISVGDVVGRGLASAVAMGQLRSAIRALSETGAGPGPVLDQVDRFVARVPGAWMATVALVEVRPADGQLRYSSAGHLPALVVDPDGTAEYLWDGRSTPLAAVADGNPRPTAKAEVPRGSRLLLFTDGLVERVGRDIDVGLGTVAQAAARLRHADPATMVDRLMVDLLVDETTSDDVCLLCLSL